MLICFFEGSGRRESMQNALPIIIATFTLILDHLNLEEGERKLPEKGSCANKYTKYIQLGPQKNSEQHKKLISWIHEFYTNWKVWQHFMYPFRSKYWEN